MATFASDELGHIDDRVRLTLGGEDLLIAESYRVRQAFLTQPSIFEIRIGHAGVVASLLKRYPPGTPYQLSIGDVLQQTGRIDDVDSAGDANGSSVNLTGRDALAPLLDAYIQEDETFTNATYADMTLDVLRKVVGEAVALVYTNEANRSVQAGGKVKQSAKPTDAQEVRTDASPSRPIQAKAGQRWLGLLREQHDRAGLFLLAAADGTFILTAPNGKQEPIGRIVRRLGQTRNEVNVVSHRFTNKTSVRHDSVVIYGRGGGGKAGRTKTEAIYEDAEFKGYGFPPRPLVIRDAKASSNGQAQTLARRRTAEAKRAGFTLQYVLSGHTVPRISGGGRVVWTVDTVVEVDDQLLGISDPYWVESVEFARSSAGTQTTVTLMRPDDLVFGDPEA